MKELGLQNLSIGESPNPQFLLLGLLAILNRHVFGNYFNNKNRRPCDVRMTTGLKIVDGSIGSCVLSHRSDGVQYCQLDLDAGIKQFNLLNILGHELIHAFLAFSMYDQVGEEEHNDYFIFLKI